MLPGFADGCGADKVHIFGGHDYRWITRSKRCQLIYGLKEGEINLSRLLPDINLKFVQQWVKCTLLFDGFIKFALECLEICRIKRQTGCHGMTAKRS
ncbi:MAG: hypothetical protein ACD_34C00432G0001 [uncultured bacterium]|nr:MAG: hypothetical protein ACD_34C00432G0001 [uncultured bacterium]